MFHCLNKSQRRVRQLHGAERSMLRLTTKSAHGLFILADGKMRALNRKGTFEHTMAYLTAPTSAYQPVEPHGKNIFGTRRKPRRFQMENRKMILNMDAVTWKHRAGESVLFSVQTFNVQRSTFRPNRKTSRIPTVATLFECPRKGK